MEKWRLQKKSESQMEFEPTTLRDQNQNKFKDITVLFHIF